MWGTSRLKTWNMTEKTFQPSIALGKHGDARRSKALRHAARHCRLQQTMWLAPSFEMSYLFFLRSSCAWEKLLQCPAIHARDHCSRSKLRTPCVKSLQCPIHYMQRCSLATKLILHLDPFLHSSLRGFLSCLGCLDCRAMEHATMLAPIVARGQQCPKHDIACVDEKRKQRIVDGFVETKPSNDSS